MIAAKAMFDTTLELPNETATISTSLNSNPMALPTTPLSGIRVPCIEPIDSIPMPKPLPVLTLVPTPSSPALNPIPIVPSIDPIPLVPPFHEEIVNPTPVTPPLVELPLVKIAIAVKLNPFSNNPPLLRRHGRRLVRVRIADEPLDRSGGLRGIVLGREPEPRVLDYGEAMVDQALVLAGQEESHGHENQSQEEILRSGELFLPEVEEE